jgi:hypothetical protein
MNIFDPFPKLSRLRRQKKGNENESWPSVGSILFLILIWPLSFWLIWAVISTFFSVGAYFFRFSWRKALKAFLSPVSFVMLTGWLMLGGAVGVFAAGLWFRPPMVILGLSVGTIVGFFMTTNEQERLPLVLLGAILGMLLPSFFLELENVQMVTGTSGRVFSLIGVIGQGSYTLYNKWSLLTEASENLQEET